MSVAVIIPALDEEQAIGRVIEAVPRRIVSEVVVVDNGSRDKTAELASRLGATVLTEPRRGYGAACLRGIDYLRQHPPEVVVFLDGDGSDHPEEMPELLRPITAGEADLVLGSRIRGRRDPGAMLPHSYWGNIFCCALINLLHGTHFTDMGPFRAIRFEALLGLELQDVNFGWTAEMQIKAAQKGLSIVEVPVSYRRRVGRSKVSGTLRGSLAAAAKIVWTALRMRIKGRA